MTLTIDKLSTRCRLPKGAERAGSLVEEVTRGPLERELNSQLGPSLDRLPAVVRMKELQVKLRVPARELSEAKLAAAWAREFSLALHKALARPESSGSDTRRHASLAQYKASLIQHLLLEGSSPTWEFPELETQGGTGTAESSYEFLAQRPTAIEETFAELLRRGWLEPLLGLWGELRLEQIMQLVAAESGAGRGLSLRLLSELGRLAAAPGGLHAPWPAASRRQALRLWSRAAGTFHIRDVWHGLRLLVRILEQPMTLSPQGAAFLADPIPFPDWCEQVRQEVAQGMRAGSPVTPPSPADSFRTVLPSLREVVPSAATPGQPAVWVRSNFCGVLLLLSVVRRLDLWRLAREPEFARFGGPRAFSFFLAAIGMTLVGDWTPDAPMDPAVELFAGILKPLDRRGLEQFFAEASPKACSSFVPGNTWVEVLQNLADELTRTLTRRIRGFRDASHTAAVRQIVRRPGRVLVEAERLLVILEPSPWWVALHISGLDESLPAVEWITGPRVEFVLEGL